MKETKTILLIMPYGSVGGMERLALTFYNHYKTQGYTIKALKLIKLDSDIINFGDDECFFSDKDFGYMSVVQRILFYLSIPFKLRRLIKKNQITHSIAFGDMANVFSSLTFTKEFKIASIHALKSAELSAKNMFNTIFSRSYKTSYRFFDKVVCISQAIKEDLLEHCGYAFDNLEVIYNPHNITEIKRLSELPLEDVSEASLFDKKSILFLGRLSMQKSPWHLLKAFYLLQQNKKEDINLIFIGDGEEHVSKYLAAYVDFLGLSDQVYFMGRRSNPYQYLVKADILALSSLYEGTPNVIVESLAVKIPIVTTRCTDGILELMSLNPSILKEDSELLFTEGGVITPNLFKGSIAMPESMSTEGTIEEQKLMEGMQYALHHNQTLKQNIATNYEALLSKFALKNVASAYLQYLKA